MREAVSAEHELYMRRALTLARLAEGQTAPNPLVGAVLVKDGIIVGEGYHRRAGSPHAEVEALQQAGDKAHGATAYVTLEPCAHHGRTPPCSLALASAEVATVYYAVEDPNPLVNGKGHQQMVARGIEVHAGLCREEALKINRPFFKQITTGIPFVTAKFAMSLDGKIATAIGESQWITGELARRQGHRLRQISDAILVGVGTVLADDPRLTTRLDDVTELRHPLRVVVDSDGRTPLTAQILGQGTLLATTERVNPTYVAQVEALGAELWQLPCDEIGRVDLLALLKRLGQKGILSVMVEGGSTILGRLLELRQIDRVWAFIAPMLIGGQAPSPFGGAGIAHLQNALRLEQIEIEKLGNDIWLRGEIAPQARMDS